MHVVAPRPRETSHFHAHSANRADYRGEEQAGTFAGRLCELSHERIHWKKLLESVTERDQNVHQKQARVDHTPCLHNTVEHHHGKPWEATCAAISVRSNNFLARTMPGECLLFVLHENPLSRLGVFYADCLKHYWLARIELDYPLACVSFHTPPPRSRSDHNSAVRQLACVLRPDAPLGTGRVCDPRLMRLPTAHSAMTRDGV